MFLTSAEDYAAYYYIIISCFAFFVIPKIGIAVQHALNIWNFQVITSMDSHRG